jgi:hypothetical protein
MSVVEVAALVERGDRDAAARLWRSAARNYRGALELDPLHRETVERVVKIASRLGNQLEWISYARVLEDAPAWPRFECRSAHLVAHDGGTVVQCTGVGAVIDLMMTDATFIEAHPDPRFTNMPLPMALIILRRALWPTARPAAPKPESITVAFGGRSQVWLDARGDWGPAVKRTYRRAPGAKTR